MVMNWQRPFVVVCVSTIAGAIVSFTMVMQYVLSMIVAVLSRSLLWIFVLGLWAVSRGGSYMARMSMSRLFITSTIPSGLYCFAILRDARRVYVGCGGATSAMVVF